MDRYVSLLMGEIPRLTDNAEGYGPLGKNFIAHVNIPDGVREAFEQLKEEYGSETRAANPEFASAQHGQNPEQTADPVSGEKEQSC